MIDETWMKENGSKTWISAAKLSKESQLSILHVVGKIMLNPNVEDLTAPGHSVPNKEYRSAKDAQRTILKNMGQDLTGFRCPSCTSEVTTTGGVVCVSPGIHEKCRAVHTDAQKSPERIQQAMTELDEQVKKDWL